MIGTFHTQNRNSIYTPRPSVTTITSVELKNYAQPRYSLVMEIDEIFGSSILEFGIQVSESQNFNTIVETYSSIFGGAVGVQYGFNALLYTENPALPGLSYDKDYYYRGYAIDQIGIGYGDIKHFKTFDGSVYSLVSFNPSAGIGYGGIEVSVLQTYIDYVTSMNTYILHVSENPNINPIEDPSSQIVMISQSNIDPNLLPYNFLWNIGPFGSGQLDLIAGNTYYVQGRFVGGDQIGPPGITSPLIPVPTDGWSSNIDQFVYSY